MRIVNLMWAGISSYVVSFPVNIIVIRFVAYLAKIERFYLSSGHFIDYSFWFEIALELP